MRRLLMVLLMLGLTGPAMAAVTTTHVGKDMGTPYVNPPEPAGGRFPGDHIGDPFTLPGVPCTVTGTTVGFSDDSDEVCPSTGGTAPDVVYMFVATTDIFVDIDLCYSAYDTKLYVYDSTYTPGYPYACDDDFNMTAPCYTYTSKLESVPFVAGHTYYIVIDGYGASSGAYQIDVTEPGPAGACCAPSGACSITTQVTCPGVWQGENTTCVPNLCPQPRACCSPNGAGACELKFLSQCGAPNVWHEEWAFCAPNPCPPPVGACCNPDGTCTVRLRTDCQPPNTWFYDDGFCVQPPCPYLVHGVGCSPSGKCRVTHLGELEPGEVWHDEWWCDPNPCPQPITAIRVKINVLNNAEIDEATAGRIVDKANRILKEAGAKIRLQWDPGHFRTGYDEGNGNGDIEPAEREQLNKNGNAELKEFGDGKGCKLMVADTLSFTPGAAGAAEMDPVNHVGTDNHVICLDDRDDVDWIFERWNRIAYALAHELGHVLGLDHVLGANCLMNNIEGNPLSPVALLTEDELQTIAGNAPKLGKTQMETWNRQMGRGSTLEPLAIRRSLWVDSLGDASPEYADLTWGRFYGFDPFVNLELSVRINGFLPSWLDSLDYEIGINSDGNAGTGAAWAGYPGIDKVIRIRLSGAYPYDGVSGAIEGELIDLAGGGTIRLEPGSVARAIRMIDMKAPAHAVEEEAADEVLQKIDPALLEFGGEVAFYAVRSVLWSGTLAVQADVTGLEEFWFNPPPDPAIVVSPTAATPGEVVGVCGSRFAPWSPIEVRVEDDLVAMTATDGSGAFNTGFTVPLVADGMYFVTARDTTSAFDFGVLTTLITEGTDHERDGIRGMGSLQAHPNPFTDLVEFVLPGSGPGAVEFFDVAGRMLRRYDLSSTGEGSRHLVWDGTDGAGRAVPTGLYWVRIIRGEVRSSAPILRVR